MRPTLLTLLVSAFIYFFSCQQPATNPSSSLTADSLHKLMAQYEPGLGEIMGGIQTHHAKLWYAAINDNWDLAQYRSEEHTSELQSHVNLVCRLLLEKKKKKKNV